MRVAVDAMGGDHGPAVVVNGATAAARHADVRVTLVGDAEELHTEMARHPDASRLDILVVHAADVVGMGERPAEALRRRPRSSIRVAADLVARGGADALFSAGNTGATVLAAYTGFGLLRGADRPALAAAVPTIRGTAVLLDIGANADCRPPHLVAFAAMNLGAFAVLALAGTREAPMEHLHDYRGLWHSSPVMAGLLTVFLLSLGGFPPTAGFVAKWYVFSAAVRAGQFSFAIIGVLTSVVSVFFYLRIVVMMYMSEKKEAAAPPRAPGPALAALALSAVVLFYLGVLPTRVLDLAARSVASMF